MTLYKDDVLRTHKAWLANGKSREKTAAQLDMSISGVNRRLEAYRDRYDPKRATIASDQAKTAVTFDDILVKLRKTPLSVKEIALAVGATPTQVQFEIDGARNKGVNLHEFNGKWSVEKAPALRPTGANARYEMTSTNDNKFVFGFVTDNHLGSKYARLDVLNDMYDRFAARGITTVFNAGNYIDGEARFNKFDLEIHGMDAQLKFLAKNYPQRKGITTRFIAGDDHEGWYGQREGIDIGRWTEHVMKEHGREDFIYLGFMEADIGLVNANTGRSAVCRVVHPGGGSSYAISYSMQKLVESYEGGDKPAVVLGGHYHKQEILNYRNVWIVQGGTTEDQTPFMRKKKLEAHVGGLIITLDQDPKTGAIVACNDIYRYFNKQYYHDRKARGERFSYAGKVALRERTLGGV